jgi:hypothetical protein
MNETLISSIEKHCVCAEQTHKPELELERGFGHLEEMQRACEKAKDNLN